MAATLRITQGTEKGTFRFSYITGTGEELMQSPTFSSKAELDQAVSDLRLGSMMSERISVVLGDDGRKYFQIENLRGQSISRSIGFDSEMLFNNALHSVRTDACVAQIADETA